jgi:hypothetical protein
MQNARLNGIRNTERKGFPMLGLFLIAGAVLSGLIVLAAQTDTPAKVTNSARPSRAVRR